MHHALLRQNLYPGQRLLGSEAAQPRDSVEISIRGDDVRKARLECASSMDGVPAPDGGDLSQLDGARKCRHREIVQGKSFKETPRLINGILTRTHRQPMEHHFLDHLDRRVELNAETRCGQQFTTTGAPGVLAAKGEGNNTGVDKEGATHPHRSTNS